MLTSGMADIEESIGQAVGALLGLKVGFASGPEALYLALYMQV